MSDFLPFSRPSMGDAELAALREVLASGWITTGPKNQALEAAFCQLTGNRHAIAVSSATGGMHVTLMALGIGPGDEVITPSQTWVSTLNMICLLGATPVMIDVDNDNLMITPEAVEAAITPRTKAIIPVHYAGAPADIDAGLRQLQSLPGIGRWTANYFALRGWQAKDIFLPDDYLIKQRFPGMTPAAIARYARRWQPMRSYALLHIWYTDDWIPAAE